MGGYYTAHATSGYAGLSRLKKQKLEAAGSSGAVQASRMENDGPAAPTANSEMVEPNIATADWSLPNFRFAHDPTAATRLAVTSRLQRTDDLTSANVPDATSAIRLRAGRVFPAFAAILIPASVLSKKSARLSMSVRASSSPSI